MTTSTAKDTAAAEACLARGDALLASEDYVGALAAYNESAAYDCTDSEVWLSRGILFEELGRWREAAGSYHRAFALEPGDDDISRYCASASQKAAGYAAAAAATGISTLASRCCCSVADVPAVGGLGGLEELAANIAAGLRHHHHAVVDHFCTDTAELRAWIRALHTGGKLKRGEVLASAQASARNDITTSISATKVDTHPPTLRGFIATLDATVHALQQQLPHVASTELATDDATAATTAGTATSIPQSLLRDEMQATCYPSGGGGYASLSFVFVDISYVPMPMAVPVPVPVAMPVCMCVCV